MSTRRGFLAGIFALGKSQDAKPKPFAPFIDHSKLSACMTCQEHKCVTSCPTNIIIIESSQPVLDFSLGGCDMCGECFDSCDVGVFSVKEDTKVNAKIILDVTACMAYKGTICKSCYDPCDEKAIVFAGLFYPQIDMVKCTSCGFCIRVCPTNAIGAIRNVS
jgi:ferredoxin-type protein NapF